jgi:two-component system sensor histidine kinase FlrB
MGLALVLENPKSTALNVTPELLTQAFASFSQAADSLESCYRQLQNEVMRLREQLEDSNRDLAESVARNEAMRDFLERTLDNLPCGVVVVTEHDCCQKVNLEAQRILGNTTSQGFSSNLHAIAASVHGELGDSEQILTLQNASGTAEIAVRRASLSQPDGSISDTVLLLRDVTMERRLEKEQDRVQRAHALAEISAMLAHEIRNPLAVVELVTGLVEEQAHENPELQNWLSHIQAGLRTLSATVNNVLQYHADPKANLQGTELGCLLDESIEFLRPLIRQQQMHVRFSNRAGAVFVDAHSEQLRHAIFNLGMNAIRAMQPGGTLDIALLLSADMKRALVQFRDNGCGIAAPDIEQIFTPGYSTRPGAPGLGLAVCRRIMKQHGGEVRVQSAPGEGSTFTLDLPVSGGNA